MEIKTKFNIGDVVTYKGEPYKIGLIKVYGSNPANFYYSMISMLDTNKTFGASENELQPYKEPILTVKEKEYIRCIIKPFRHRVLAIQKFDDCIDPEQYICIRLLGESFSLPGFGRGTMYKGMDTDRVYTLGDLGL